MNEPWASRRISVKLPVANLEDAQKARASLDKEVHQGVTEAAAHDSQLALTHSVDDRNNQTLSASGKGYDLTVASRCGQDSALIGGEQRSFFSYTVSASCRLQAMARAESATTELRFYLRCILAVVFAVLFFFGIDLLLVLTEMPSVRIPVIVIIAVVLAGAWVGERVGAFIGGKLEAATYARVDKEDGPLPKLELVWSNLEERLRALLAKYEAL